MTFLLVLAELADYATAHRATEANVLVQRAMDAGLALGAKAALCLLVVSAVVIIRRRRPWLARFVAGVGIAAGLVGMASNLVAVG